MSKFPWYIWVFRWGSGTVSGNLGAYSVITPWVCVWCRFDVNKMTPPAQSSHPGCAYDVILMSIWWPRLVSHHTLGVRMMSFWCQYDDPACSVITAWVCAYDVSHPCQLFINCYTCVSPHEKTDFYPIFIILIDTCKWLPIAGIEPMRWYCIGLSVQRLIYSATAAYLTTAYQNAVCI